MKLIILKPTTPSKRHYLNILNKVNKINIFKKKLTFKPYFITKNISLNNNITAIVYTIEYDSNQNANIAALFDLKKKLFFSIIAPKSLKLGNIIKIGEEAEKRIGHCIKLKKVPIGCPIYNIFIKLNSINPIAKSAGTFCLLTSKSQKNINLLLNSGKNKLVSNNCFSYIGIVSNEFFFLKQLGKAGRINWLNKKPSVRGVAMNPIDHPNGGGEGKKSSKNKSPWGKIKNSKKK